MCYCEFIPFPRFVEEISSGILIYANDSFGPDYYKWCSIAQTRICHDHIKETNCVFFLNIVTLYNWISKDHFIDLEE